MIVIEKLNWLKDSFLSFVQHVIMLFIVFLIRFKIVKRVKVELKYGLLNFGFCTEALGFFTITEKSNF